MRASSSPRRAAPRVGAGTAATVRIDGSDRDWKAEVRYVSSEAAFTPYYALNARERGRLAYLAEVVLTEPDAATLPTGMPVEVTLAAGRAGAVSVAITARDLARRFGTKWAVDGIDLDVPRAQIYGFLGPERLGQVHHDPHALRAAGADARHGGRARAFACRATPRSCAASSAT